MALRGLMQGATCMVSTDAMGGKRPIKTDSMLPNYQGNLPGLVGVTAGRALRFHRITATFPSTGPNTHKIPIDSILSDV